MALDASIYVEGANGRRRIAAEDFFTGWFSTGLADDELLTNVVIAPMTALDPGGTVEWGFEELARRQGDFAMVLAATILWRDRAGMITDARVVAGGVGAAPVRCRAAKQRCKARWVAR